jgi:hypothetical protein
MPVYEDWPDPREARDAAGFVAAMRTLRGRVELSFRVLERRAEQAGDVLPTSTMNAALSRDKLPRADLVAAFVRACGGDEPTVEAWLAARAALANGGEEPEQAERPRRSRRREMVLAVASAVALVAVAIVVYALTTDEAPNASPDIAGSSGTTSVAAEEPNVIVIQTAHNRELCLGEVTERGNPEQRIVLGQQECATAGPPISVEPVGKDGPYRLILHHPQYGPGCVTVDLGGADPGLLLAGADCQDDRADQQFTLEPVDSPADGHRLRSVSGATWCIGVLNRSTEPGVQLMQEPCADNNPYQVFVLQSERPDAW